MLARRDPRGTARVRVPKAGQLVADMIRNQITCGSLSDGDFLPRGAALCEQLGVSKSTLREAFRILEVEGLISIVQGSRGGARVQKPGIDVAVRSALSFLSSQDVTFVDLSVARLAIELPAVRRLAESRNKDAHALLWQLVGQLDAHLQSVRYPSALSLAEEFRHQLVVASGLEPLILFSAILRTYDDTHDLDSNNAKDRWTESTPTNSALSSLRTTCLGFKQLLHHTSRGQSAAAVAFWEAHFHSMVPTAARICCAQGDVSSAPEHAQKRIDS